MPTKLIIRGDRSAFKIELSKAPEPREAKPQEKAQHGKKINALYSLATASMMANEVSEDFAESNETLHVSDLFELEREGQ